MRAKLNSSFFMLVCLRTQNVHGTAVSDSTDHHQGKCWDVPSLRNSEADFSQADDVRK